MTGKLKLWHMFLKQGKQWNQLMAGFRMFHVLCVCFPLHANFNPSYTIVETPYVQLTALAINTCSIFIWDDYIYIYIPTIPTIVLTMPPKTCSSIMYAMQHHLWTSSCSFPFGYGSIPINTIFRGMNIHLPAILMFTRGTRFWHTAIWPEKKVVARLRNPTQAIGVSFFFVSFNLVNGIVLINVAIAVLLEKMVDDESDKHHHEVLEESDGKCWAVALWCFCFWGLSPFSNQNWI